jgi:hypothetical protein
MNPVEGILHDDPVARIEDDYEIFRVKERFKYNPREHKLFGFIFPKSDLPYVKEYTTYQCGPINSETKKIIAACQRRPDKLVPLKLDFQETPRFLYDNFKDDIYTFEWEKLGKLSEPGSEDYIQYHFNPSFTSITKHHREHLAFRCMFCCLVFMCGREYTNYITTDRTYRRDPNKDFFYIILKKVSEEVKQQ